MRVRTYLLLFAVPVFLLGCMGADGATGPDGEDGGTAVALTWAFTPQSISMSDPNFPRVFTKDTFYWTLAGSYRVSYIAWDGSSWSGNYTVNYDPGTLGEPGEKGGVFWKKGRDGAPGIDGLDYFYRIGLYSTGPTITFVGSSVLLQDSLVEAAVNAEKQAKMTSPQPSASLVDSIVRRTVTSGPWTIHYEFRRLEMGGTKSSPSGDKKFVERK